jgi:hypothetical protein
MAGANPAGNSDPQGNIGTELAARVRAGAEGEQALHPEWSAPKQQGPAPIVTPAPMDKVNSPTQAKAKTNETKFKKQMKSWSPAVFDDGGMVKVPTMQHAANEAEKRGDTATQATVKKMQYPDKSWPGEGISVESMPPEARSQVYRTQEKSAINQAKNIHTKVGTYDDGGKVTATTKTGRTVKVNDGKHVVGILKEGERVLTPEQNKHYEEHMKTMDMVHDALSGGARKPKKAIREMVHSKTHNGKHVVVHKHHHPEHHPDETHMMNDMNELHAHMEDHAGAEPNQGEGPESAPQGNPAQLSAAAPEMPPAGGAGPMPGMGV